MLFTPCIIYHEHLVAKKLSTDFKNVPKNVVKIVNEIRSLPSTSISTVMKVWIWSMDIFSVQNEDSF